MATRFDDLVRQYTSDPSVVGPTPVDLKKQEVARAAEAKRYELSVKASAEAVPFYNVAAVRSRGSGLSTITDPVQRDLATMDNWSLYQKYGSQTGQLFDAYNVGASNYAGDRQAALTIKGSLPRVKDVALSAGQGFSNSVLGIPALASGLVSDKAGVWSARKLSDMNDWFNSRKSDESQIHNRRFGVENSLDQADNLEQFEEDKARDGEFVATLKRFGRDTFNTLDNAWDDPEVLRDTVAQGIGSLGAGGLIAKAVKKMGKAALGRAVASGALAEGGAVASRVATYGSKATMPLVIGGMEAGGAYQQTIMDAYDTLSQRDDLSEADKERLANRAGLTAAAIQAPISILTGTLVSKFEANPFSVGSVRSAAGNILKEAVEEGAQSASGQIAQNYGIRENVDQTRDLAQGVGEQTALGVIGGAGSAALVQAPGATLRATVQSAKLAGRTALNLGQGAMRGLESRNQRILDTVNEQSPVSAPKMDAAFSAAAAAAPEVRASAVSSVENASGLNQEEKRQSTEYLDKLFESVTFRDEEADNQIPVIGDAIRGSTDRFDAMRRVSSIAADNQADPKSRLAAGLYLMDTIRRYQSMIDQVPEAIEKMSDEDPALSQVRDFEDVMLNIQRHPAIREAIQAAVQFDKAVSEQDVSDENIATPEGQQAARTAVQLSSLAPERSDPAVNKQVLLHAEQGKVDLSPEQIGYLRSANALHEVEARHAEKSKTLGLTNSEAISREIQTDPSDPGTLHKSAISHMEGITAAVDSGNIPLAQRRLQHLMGFAQSMQNKVLALNANLERGDGGEKNRTPYKAYNPRTGQFFESKPGAYLIGGSRGSVAQAQQTAVDADAVGYLANEIARAFPQLGVEPIELAQLHAAVSQGPAREVARDYKIAQRDGTVAQFMGESVATSPNKPVQAALNATLRDVDQNNRQETSLSENAAEAAPPARENQESRQTGPSQDQRTSDTVSADTEAQVRPAPSESDARRSTTVDPVEDTAPAAEAVTEAGQSDRARAEPRPEDQVSTEDQAREESVSEKPQQADVSGISAAYPNLLGLKNGDGKTGLFARAFKLPAENPISYLTGVEGPLSVIRNALSSASKFRAQVGGNETGGRVTTEVARAYSEYLANADAISKSMDTRLRKVLADRKAKNKRLDPAFEELRALSIVDEDPTTGELSYNTELRDNAVLAGLQWLLTADQRQRPLEDEDVAKILNIPVTNVTEDQVTRFNQGFYLASSVSDLARTITRFWGVVPDSNAPEGFVRGIPEGVAKEILRGMEAAGLISIVEIKEGGRTYYQVQNLAEQKLGEERYASLASFPSAIEVASVVEPEEVSFIGAPPSRVATTQLRNPLVRLTSQQTQMIEAEQATPFYVNETMLGFLDAIGEDAAVDLFGYGELSEQGMNRNHRQSLESINLTVRSAFRSIQHKALEARNWANANKMSELGEVPIHYGYEFTSVNRLQMIGRHNPQANKLTREVILPTRSTLDLTDPTDMGRFMLGVAQAWGVKVHKKVRAESVREAQELARGAYAPAIEVLSSWLQNPSKTTGLDNEDVRVLRETLGNGGPVSPVALHAAVEYARFLNQKEKNSFSTSLYVEADGITDGPINAMVHTVRGSFTPEWVNVMRKGGLFFGQPGMTANRSGDPVDLYQHTTNFLKQSMANLRRELSSNAPVRSQMDSLLRVMTQLLPEIGFNQETGELEIQRGAVKNPLTVTIYGAGSSGIASKITRAITKAVYERESRKLSLLAKRSKATQQEIADHLFGKETSSPEEALRRYREYNQDMSTLLDTRVEKSENSLIVVDTSGDMPVNTSMKTGPQNFTMLPQQVENLRRNVLQLFVGPMRQAIAASIGETDAGTSALRRATQVQSIYLQYAFQRAVQAELDRKSKDEPGFKKSDFLSQKELQAIYSQLKHLAPFVETGTQNMLVSGSEKVSVADVSFSRSLEGDLATPAYVYGPVNSGVSGIPLTIIGTGDGQMMQNASTMVGAPEGTLKIFDGMNMKLTTIEDDSRAINEAVYRGWVRNPLADVAKSYAEFVADAELSPLSEQMRSDLSEALLGIGRKDASAAQIVEMVKSLDEELQGIAREIQARKNALQRVQLTVDHMASAEASYDASPANSVSLEGLDDRQVAERLNKLYAEELAKLVTEQRPSQNIKKDLKLSGDIQGSDLVRFVNGLNVPAEQKSLLVEVARELRGTDWRVTTDPLPSGSVPKGAPQNILGATDFNSKTIHVLNGSSETLLHEMLHATTLDKVAAYYADPSSLSAEAREAVRRIEGLMSEWLDTAPADVTNLNERVRTAMANAQNAVLGHLGNADNGTASNKSNALNEFMAWVLSNQDLAKLAQRTKVQNPLIRIVGEALKMLRQLFNFKSKVGDDLYSNLKFNTTVLLRSGRPVAASLGDTILFQSGTFGSSDRLARIREAFFDKVARYVYDQADPAAKLTAQYKAFVAKVQSDAVLESFNAHGFPMDMQQASTFQMIVSALATEIELNPNSLQRAEQLYAHVSKTLTVEDFMAQPEGNDPADRFQANEKYNSVLGTNLTEIDEQGRSTLLPSFLALAAVDDGFRAVLSRMDLPKGERLPNDRLDNILTNMGSEAMDRLGVIMGGEGRNQPSVRAAIDVLTDRLARVDTNQREYIEQFVAPVGNAVDKANKFVIDQMTRLSEQTSNKLENVKQNSNKKSVKALANVGQLVAGIFNEDVADAQARSLMSLANKHLSSQTMHEFLNELVGRTSENASIYDMIKTVRSAVQSMRQQFREHLPELLAKRFDRPVTEEEWSSMFHGMARTDLASLRSAYSVAQIVDLLEDPQAVRAEASVLEGRVRNGAASTAQANLMIQKAKELAGFMNTGRAPKNLLRNAHAIVALLGEGVRVSYSDEVRAQLTRDVDHLVSLYALQGLSDADKNILTELGSSSDTRNGVSFMLSYLEGQRRDELAGSQGNDVALFNHFKGYVPSIQQGKSFSRTLVVADDTNYLDLRQRGFNRVAEYRGSGAEVGQGKKGYYFSSLSGRSVYNQGIIQTVHPTVSGVDPVTGFSTSLATAGRITDPVQVQRAQRRLSSSSGSNQSNTGENLMPVFDGQGNLVAYERSIDPDQEQRLGRSSNIAEMMGVWRGRQVEELLAQKYNDALVERLHDMWNKEEVLRRDEYVNLLDPREQRRDPVMADAVRLIPRDTRQKIRDLFGENEFWVRRDMLNDALGYRKASVGDAWTGTTRFSEETQKNVRNIAINVFGIDAYKRMVQAEKLIQNVVTDMRVLIVVKSVIIPVTNLIANVYQLSARGVPLASTIKGMPGKTAEVDSYVQGRIRVMEIDAELRAAEGANDVVKIRKLGVEKQSVEDGWKRLSIWPLIEAGELTSVSDVGIGKEEIDLTEGRLMEYMENLTNKLPDSVKTAGKYFIIGKDTALFKGLQRTVEYGDFLAKAILYDDLVKRQGLSQEEALAKVTEEFVNYDRLAGRTRDYLENMGLMWFWNFKIRSTKIALSMIRNNPVHAMLTGLAPAPPFIGSVGNPLSDNILSIALDGRLDNSIGPGQGLRAHNLLPWFQLIG